MCYATKTKTEEIKKEGATAILKFYIALWGILHDINTCTMYKSKMKIEIEVSYECIFYKRVCVTSGHCNQIMLRKIGGNVSFYAFV